MHTFGNWPDIARIACLKSLNPPHDLDSRAHVTKTLEPEREFIGLANFEHVCPMGDELAHVNHG